MKKKMIDKKYEVWIFDRESGSWEKRGGIEGESDSWSCRTKLVRATGRNEDVEAVWQNVPM